jgi:hypothetical protein
MESWAVGWRARDRARGARADLLEAEAEIDALTGAILPRYHVALAR